MHQTVFQAGQLPFDGHPFVRRHLWLDSGRDARASRRRSRSSLLMACCECGWTAVWCGPRDASRISPFDRLWGATRKHLALSGPWRSTSLLALAGALAVCSPLAVAATPLIVALSPGRRAAARIRGGERSGLCVCRRRLRARRVCVGTCADFAHRAAGRWPMSRGAPRNA